MGISPILSIPLFFCFLSPCFSFSLADPPSKTTSHTLTQHNFKSAIASGHWLVEYYYTPPCSGHCDSFARAWEKFVDQSEFVDALKFAQVDCVLNRDLCEANRIIASSNSPQLILYRDGVERVVSGLLLDEVAFTQSLQYLVEIPTLSSSAPTRDPSTEITLLTPENFTSLTRGPDPMFVNFCVPGSDECKRLSPIWKALGTIMQGAVPAVDIAEVDCGSHLKFCQTQIGAGPTRYPKLMIYYPQRYRPLRYGGPRTLDQLAAFAQKGFIQAPLLPASKSHLSGTTAPPRYLEAIEITHETYQRVMEAPILVVASVGTALGSDIMSGVASSVKRTALAWARRTHGTGLAGGRAVQFAWQNASMLADRDPQHEHDVRVVIVDHEANKSYFTEESGAPIRLQTASILSTLQTTFPPPPPEGARKASAVEQRVTRVFVYITDHPLRILSWLAVIIGFVCVAVCRLIGEEPERFGGYVENRVGEVGGVTTCSECVV
ncbi:hypothetical protein C8F04DRAFT_425725 [Mycena alexandri]|uniref:Thioredoxin domain-containing protein n=1 Tax=Mycena alexandri TaxID=1745969 RepID=A0AAD6RYI8_9AGAR|nr:hypothetical protein C8F04DRAFT_425725 [Mycena alexandri]